MDMSCQTVPFLFKSIFICLFMLVSTSELSAVACGIYFCDHGLNPGPLHWEYRVLSHWTTRDKEMTYLPGNLPFFKIHVNHFLARDDADPRDTCLLICLILAS